MTATGRDYRERILRVLVHIQHNLDAALSLEELSRVASFSPFHFHRIFAGMVGESVKQHVRRLRLERAAARLKHTELSVTRIAFEAGYEAPESFTRAFRRAFDCSPREFRSAASLSPRIVTANRVHYAAPPSALGFEPILLEETAVQIEIKTLDRMRVAFVRHVGPYTSVGDAWDQLTDWVGAECLFGPEHVMLGACWDDPEVTAPERIRYDACITVGDGVSPAGEIGIQTLGGARYAVALHEGPYDKINQTYAHMFGIWFAKQRWDPGDAPSLELYLNDPESTEPRDLLTEVCVRIADGG